jgi:hypothetical protein
VRAGTLHDFLNLLWPSLRTWLIIGFAVCRGADSLRYLSLHDNSYIKYLEGHKGKCVWFTRTVVVTPSL